MYYAIAYLYFRNKGKNNQKDKTMKTAETTTSRRNEGTTYNREGRKVKVSIPTRDEDLSDNENPDFLFSTTFTSLLTKIAHGDIDAEFYARRELANRGLDLNGNWIGFKAAAKEHKI